VTQAATRAIHILAPEVAARIAAGEVVERPYSVVRELLDNAIDAGATRIAIEIEGGGVDLIRIVDNGSGIPPGDLELAFERHATSKILAADDIGRLATLGFRGEALPSIAAAADIEVVSRVEEEPVGVQLLLTGGRPVSRRAKSAPPGLAFTARDLFGRHPARRKFLANAATESRQVATLVSHYALAYPEVSFHLSSNGRRLLGTPGRGDAREAFGAVYGADQAAAMLEVAHAEDGVRVAGLAGPPSVTRGNRSAISVFVNRRWVQSRALVFAVVDAYQSQLPIGRHPVAAIDISVPADDVDVNVHPAKASVRFRDERAVARVVRHAVRASLEDARVVAWAPRTPDPSPWQGGGESPLSARMAPPALRPPESLQAALPSPASEPDPSGTHRETLPLLHVVGQMSATYVVAEGPSGMYMIDQHAAHERVRYEQVVKARASSAGAPSQPLLEPVLLDLEPALASVLLESIADLESLGFEIATFGEESFVIRAVPPGIAGRGLAVELRSFLGTLGDERRVTDPFQRAAATVACHSSVRAGTAMSLEEMRALVRDLEATEAPRTCPHGRPTLVFLSADALGRQFGR
jgi:DNA mismatch repair protein MutL